MAAQVRQLPAGLALVSALAVTIGSFLPWETLNSSFFSTSITGTTANDGWWSLVVGAIAAGTAVHALTQHRPHQRVLLAACGAVVLGLAVIEWVRFAGDGTGIVQSTFSMSISVGIGIYVIGAGGIGLLVSSLLPARSQ